MICILSYCNTTKKKTQLFDLIQSIKENYPGQKILVYSHFQNIEPEYYSGADYYIFDHTNPKSPKKFCDWLIIPHQGKKFYRWGSDWGFAVLQMMKRASLFIKSISEEGCLFLNYDSDPTKLRENEMLKLSGNLDNNQIGIFAPWGKSQSQFNMTCFYLDLPKIETSFFKEITLDWYNSFSGSIIPEGIFKLLVDKKYPGGYIMSFAIASTFSEVSRQLPIDSPLNKFFGNLLLTRNNGGSDRRKCLAAWNTTKKINQMEVAISAEKFLLQNEVGGENGNLSFFSHLPEEYPVDSISVLAIDGEKINPPHLIEGLDDNYWDSNYHETV